MENILCKKRRLRDRQKWIWSRWIRLVRNSINEHLYIKRSHNNKLVSIRYIFFQRKDWFKCRKVWREIYGIVKVLNIQVWSRKNDIYFAFDTGTSAPSSICSTMEQLCLISLFDDLIFNDTKVNNVSLGKDREYISIFMRTKLLWFGV